METNMLKRRAMLFTLNLTAYSARKLDKQVTQETNAAHNAAHDAGRYNKHLLPPEALAPIAKIDNAIRDHFRTITSPWLDRDGTRIASTMTAEKILLWFRDQRQAREMAVSDFVTNYPEYVNQARTRLNGMFRESDYPTQSAMANKFRCKLDVDPVPDAEDFRADLPPEQLQDLRREIESRSQEAIKVVTRDAFERVADTVGRMVERLNAFKPSNGKGDKAEGIFRDSLVDNVRELVDLLPGLNLANDPALTAVASRMVALTRDNADTLRDNASARESVAKEAESILADVSAYLA